MTTHKTADTPRTNRIDVSCIGNDEMAYTALDLCRTLERELAASAAYAEQSRAFVAHTLDYLQLMEKLAGDPAKSVELRQYVLEAASVLRKKSAALSIPPSTEPTKMNLTIWTGIREYIAAEIRLASLRRDYSEASAAQDESEMARIAREIGGAEAQSTRMETSVREAL